MKTKTIWIIVAVVALVFILGYFAMAAKKPPVIVNPNPYPYPAPKQTSWLDTAKNILDRFFGKKVTGYVQVAPIDDQGCDVLGYNAIGVKCSIF